MIKESELILNPDGSVYHLNLLPEDIAHTIITVGDQERVSKVSAYFDTIDVKKGKREFLTHTGTLRGKRITVISTGIGPDNIDIVFNELDALVNIDLATRKVKEKLTSLSFIRIGTSGCLQPDIPVDSILLSERAIGFDGMVNFYGIKIHNYATLLREQVSFIKEKHFPFYFADANPTLIRHFSSTETFKGITATCGGFYGPQGRVLRLPLAIPDFLDQLAAVELENECITNFEMETAAIYGMSQLLKHKALAVNALIANRPNGTFSKNPDALVKRAIEHVLERI